MAVARVTRRHHAVEHVHTASHTLDQILRLAHAHQIARLVGRHLRRQEVQHTDHLFLRFAHREAANCQAVEADLAKPFQRTHAQRLVHAALDDAKQCRRAVAMSDLGALGPTQRQLHRAARDVLVSRIGRALIEDHHDIRAQVTLDLHGLFRPHEHLGAIDRRREVDALLLDLAHRSQTEHLKTTGIGKDRPLPLHEVVQVAVALDHLGAGSQPEVKGVAQDDLRTDRFDVPRQHALDGTVGAYRHEGRRFHGSARKGQTPPTRLAIGGE